MKDVDFIDKTLIRLKREYGKDELVASLLKQISEKDIEIGKLNSEIDYLQNELQSDKDKKEFNKNVAIDTRKEEMYQKILTINKKRQKDNKRLRIDIKDLINKNYILQQKLNM